MTATCESYELRTAKETRINELALEKLGDKVKPCSNVHWKVMFKQYLSLKSVI